MSNLIERIKQRIEKEQKFDEEMWNTLASKDNCQDIAMHETRNALYDVIYRVIDEESAKEPQECNWTKGIHSVETCWGDIDVKTFNQFKRQGAKFCPYCGRKIKGD
jgi:hypothetical protein